MLGFLSAQPAELLIEVPSLHADPAAVTQPAHIICWLCRQVSIQLPWQVTRLSQPQRADVCIPLPVPVIAPGGNGVIFESEAVFLSPVLAWHLYELCVAV